MSGLEEMQFRLAVSMANIDGAVSPNEQTLLTHLGKSLNLSEKEVKRLSKEAGRIDFSALHHLYPEKDQRLQLLEMACLMAMADGQAKPEEWQFSVRLAKALHLDRTEAKICVGRARRRLLSIVKEHGMIEELRENLHKQGIGID
jgi:tellurite resistance protein